MKLRMKTSSQWIRFGQSAVRVGVKEVTVRSKKGEKQKSSVPLEFTLEMKTPIRPMNDGVGIGAPVSRLRYCQLTRWRSRTGLSVTVGNGITARWLASRF